VQGRTAALGIPVESEDIVRSLLTSAAWSHAGEGEGRLAERAQGRAAMTLCAQHGFRVHLALNMLTLEISGNKLW